MLRLRDQTEPTLLLCPDSLNSARSIGTAGIAITNAYVILSMGNVIQELVIASARPVFKVTCASADVSRDSTVPTANTGATAVRTLKVATKAQAGVSAKKDLVVLIAQCPVVLMVTLDLSA